MGVRQGDPGDGRVLQQAPSAGTTLQAGAEDKHLHERNSLQDLDIQDNQQI
jgi:hypothetical protein